MTAACVGPLTRQNKRTSLYGVVGIRVPLPFSPPSFDPLTYTSVTFFPHFFSPYAQTDTCVASVPLSSSVVSSLSLHHCTSATSQPEI